MVRFIVILSITALLIVGCIPVSQPDEKAVITQLPMPEPYVSKDYGANDYLPLAVGNEWKYQYIVKYEGRPPGGTPGSYITGKMEWSITDVRKCDDTTEEFTLMVHQQGKYNILRTTSFIRLFGDTLPRIGTDNTLLLNNKKFGKGIGFYFQPIKGGVDGGTNGIGVWTETLELVSKTIKK